MLTAYSYIRFSDIRQAGGDSERRQVELREGWLRTRPDVELDTALRLVDRGIGAFRGTHRSDKHCLGQFVRLVESAKVKPGSFLLIENLDRLSREEVHDAVELLLKLTRLGVVVVQLSPVVCEYAYPVDMSKLIIAVVELARGNSESKMKSERVSQAWKAARTRARETKAPVGLRTLPGWCELKAGKISLIPERAAIVKQCHERAQGGWGVNLIVKQLNSDGVKPWGRAKQWSEAVVHRYLTSRTVVGEWQPGEGGRGGRERRKVGDPIPDYFPQVVTEETFRATGEAMKKRHGFRGRRGKHVNIFAGLLCDPFSRGKMGYSHTAKLSRVFNYEGRVGPAPLMSYPAGVLETQLLSVLSELDPAVITGDDSAGLAVLAGEGRLREIDASLGEIEDELMRGGKASVLGKVAERLEAQRAEVAAQLEADKRKASVPSAHSWAVLKDSLDLTDDSVRLKLRSAVRDVVKSVWCVFAGHKSGRYEAVVEIMLHGGAWRKLILSADTGSKKSQRQPSSWVWGDDKFGTDGENMSPLRTIIPAEFWGGPATPQLADDVKGPPAAKAYRDGMLRELAERADRAKRPPEVEVCDCE